MGTRDEVERKENAPTEKNGKGEGEAEPKARPFGEGGHNGMETCGNSAWEGGDEGGRG